MIDRLYERPNLSPKERLRLKNARTQSPSRSQPSERSARLPARLRHRDGLEYRPRRPPGGLRRNRALGGSACGRRTQSRRRLRPSAGLGRERRRAQSAELALHLRPSLLLDSGRARQRHHPLDRGGGHCAGSLAAICFLRTGRGQSGDDRRRHRHPDQWRNGLAFHAGAGARSQHQGRCFFIWRPMPRSRSGFLFRPS